MMLSSHLNFTSVSYLIMWWAAGIELESEEASGSKEGSWSIICPSSILFHSGRKWAPNQGDQIYLCERQYRETQRDRTSLY